MKGKFQPRNPSKYRGDSSNIIYRSSWELKFMSFCDTQPNIIQWSSEELVIPYRSPIDGRVHRYFPDFLIKTLSKDGKKETIVIEVKPDKETKEPKKQKKVTKRYLYEVKTWAINKTKWEAAIKFCNERGWKFQIMTEKHLGIKY